MTTRPSQTNNLSLIPDPNQAQHNTAVAEEKMGSPNRVVLTNNTKRDSPSPEGTNRYNLLGDSVFSDKNQ
jgi:hypothetical protein